MDSFEPAMGASEYLVSGGGNNFVLNGLWKVKSPKLSLTIAFFICVTTLALGLFVVMVFFNWEQALLWSATLWAGGFSWLIWYVVIRYFEFVYSTKRTNLRNFWRCFFARPDLIDQYTVLNPLHSEEIDIRDESEEDEFPK